MSGISAERSDVNVIRIVSLRLAVGLLGERDNAGWWTSGFMSPTSAAFLTPVFGATILHARYQGVLEAAKRVHDERIGVGRAFHPFRLPEVMEQRLFDACRVGGQEFEGAISSTDAARATLEGLAGMKVEAKSGPALIGTAATVDDLEWVKEAASLYSAAFGAGVQSFPYFQGAR